MLIIEIALGIVFGLILLPIALALLAKYIDAIFSVLALIVVISIALVFFGFVVRNWSEIINEIPAIAAAMAMLILLILGFAFLDLFIRPLFCKIWMVNIPRKINFENIISTYKLNHRSAVKMAIESTLERGAIGMAIFVLFGVATLVVAVIASSFTDENMILTGIIVVAWLFAIATRRIYVGRKIQIKH